MKKLFTLAVVLSVALSGFAQVKSISRKDVKMVPQQQVVVTGMEELNATILEQPRSIMGSPIETEIGQTYYDWQTNSGPRNFVATWPDGYAVVAYTQSLNATYTDRGTGLSVYDPAVGEWTYSEGRVENEKTGFGSIARYGENGLIVAAHNAETVMFIINEDFRNGGTWSEPVYVTNSSQFAPTWPVVQCSGENNDIVHLLYTNSDIPVDGVSQPVLYSRYANGAFEVENQIHPNLTLEYGTDFSSNTVHFMPYDSEKPNRVSFIVNNAWSDGKLVISEDNGQTWSERVFYQHPNFNHTYPDDQIGFMYPRYVNAAFDGEDNLHIVYEYNGTNGAPGSGGYYLSIGGVAYWSEVLPKNELCVGGIGEVGEPFIMDSTYMMNDIYYSEWYWSDALHAPVPEYFGMLEPVDIDGNVLPRDTSEEFYWPSQEGWGLHGKYNAGKAGFPVMIYDKESNTIYSVWSQICGSDTDGVFYDGVNFYMRLFCNVSYDGGNTWEGTKAVLTDFMNMYDEMVYNIAIPYVYEDADGKFIQIVYQNDQEPGTCTQNDESVADNNFFRAVRIDLDFIGVGVEENMVAETIDMTVFPNPVTEGQVTVQVNSKSEVSIYNAVGQLVNKYNVDGNKTIDMSNYATGVYFIKADNGGATTTQKVVIK